MAMLVADIGGTHARFAVVEALNGAAPRLAHAVTVPTAAAADLSGLVDLALERGLGLPPQKARGTVLAVAGAVQDGRAWLPNAGLTVDAQDACLAGRAVVLNDFVAQAYATLHPEVWALSRVLQEGAARPGPRAVAGAGTGFGACVLMPGEADWVPLPTEMGHTPFPFLPAEQALQERILAEAGEAILDAVVSGPGLSRVHAWCTGKAMAPAAVAEAISPTHPTCAAFARLYGRALRILALTSLPTSGLFVAGGVAAKNPFLVEHPAFLEEFCACRGYEAVLAALPVRLVTHPDAGLLGAAMAGRKRRWVV
ncbi:MAG TPA: glucokinase [Desulfomicrobiaceae bacterium]|nr:glucokinase [Desulfomicrobiaceae bacterium]HCF05796.1 glucokinase [Desulfomicrobiaceae bacterium]